jgi:D-ribose pyranase
MKKDRVINPDIISAIAALGHTEFCCISDCGLPIPHGVSVVDVSVTSMVPNFISVLEAVVSELVVESYICASEIETENPAMMKKIQALLTDKPAQKIPHEEFKTLVAKAKFVIRTGETSPYANVILVGGVNF